VKTLGPQPTILQLTEHVRAFANERGWISEHHIQALVLSLASEVGELADVVRWLSSEELARDGMSAETLESLTEELADVLFTLLRLADIAQVDLVEALRAKLITTGRRYPPTT
jgi:NTP pyrophosphatase (non-canonical NTP hydrolase)